MTTPEGEHAKSSHQKLSVQGDYSVPLHVNDLEMPKIDSFVEEKSTEQSTLRPENSHLSNSFQDPVCKALLSKILKNGIFKESTEVGVQIVDALEDIAKSQLSDREAILYLRAIIANSEHQSLADNSFKVDEEQRIARRVHQLIKTPGFSNAPCSLLDIGCGDGSITDGLTKSWKIPKEKAICLEVFERRKELDSYTHMIMKDGDFPTLPMKMEVAVMLMTLHHEEDPQNLLQQTFDALEDGGKLLIREHDANSESLKLLYHALDKFYFSVLHKRDDFPIPASYRSSEEWIDMIRKSGYTVLNSYHPEPDNPNNPVHILCQKEVVEK